MKEERNSSSSNGSSVKHVGDNVAVGAYVATRGAGSPVFPDGVTTGRSSRMTSDANGCKRPQECCKCKKCDVLQ